jgi:hypothetical protein
MANPVGKLSFKIVSIVIGIPIGILTRKTVERLWLAARPDDPPHEASDPAVTWGDALGWAALSAAGVAVAELVTIKGAASVWRALTGGEPPASKADKKAKKDAKDGSDVKELESAG